MRYLVRNAESAEAYQILRHCEGPILLNRFHRLQAENFMVRLSVSPDGSPTAAKLALREWRHLLAEGVFALTPVPWEDVFEEAALLNANHPGLPPVPFLILHPAIALKTECTHFLSFTPASRAIAKRAGLTLLPERL